MIFTNIITKDNIVLMHCRAISSKAVIVFLKSYLMLELGGSQGDGAPPLFSFYFWVLTQKLLSNSVNTR